MNAPSARNFTDPSSFPVGADRRGPAGLGSYGVWITNSRWQRTPYARHMLRLVQPNEEPPEPDDDLDFLKDSEEYVNGLRTVLHRPPDDSLGGQLAVDSPES